MDMQHPQQPHTNVRAGCEYVNCTRSAIHLIREDRIDGDSLETPAISRRQVIQRLP
jgi:hypothetical protein